MTEVQEYLLKLMTEIDEICLENDIDYYIFAGSMLGLERNEGFLPWDDDIDLIMTEDNYQKFIQVMRDNPPPNRVFECKEDNKEYPLQFGKYMSTDMTGLIRPHAFGNASSGLWIDIIHATPAPNSKRRIEFIKKWFPCYCETDNEIYIQHKQHYKGFYWRYKVCLFLLSVFGKNRIDKWAKKLFNSYDEETCEQYLMYHTLYADYRFFDKKYFEKPVRRLYEGVEFSVTPYNREFCRVLFGDSWMIVPQISEQNVHLVVIDFDVPYRKYVDDYMPFLNKTEILDDIHKTKKLQLKNLEYRRRYIKQSSDLKAMLLNERLKKHALKSGVDLVKELDSGNFELIEQVYEDYENLQFDPIVSSWKVFISLDDELLYPYLKKAIFYDGQYYKANKILNLRQNAKKAPLTKDLENLKPVIEMCREMSVALWDNQDMGDLEQAINNAVVKGFDQFCIDFELAKLYLKMHKANCPEDYIKIRQDVESVLQILPEQSECIKILGDIEYEIGNLESAMMYYDTAEQTMSNGLLLLDIQKKKEAYCNVHL